MNGQKIAKVIACVNHDKNAIASHKANHPDAICKIARLVIEEINKTKTP